jgi:hypothetical protein
METKIKSKETENDFDTVKTFRKIKENISKDIWGLSYEELIKYLQNRKAKSAMS